MAQNPDVYTHGHHASVLRSHTWRTVENSAGYLLEHLTDSAHLLDVGCVNASSGMLLCLSSGGWRVSSSR